MPLTNAQKQRRYRERHLGPDGVARHALPRHCCARPLDRVAWHYRYSLTQLIEELLASAERSVEAKPSGKALAEYRATTYEDE